MVEAEEAWWWTAAGHHRRGRPAGQTGRARERFRFGRRERARGDPDPARSQFVQLGRLAGCAAAACFPRIAGRTRSWGWQALRHLEAGLDACVGRAGVGSRSNSPAMRNSAW